MIVKNKKQQIPGCKPNKNDKGKNICYNPPANSVQEIAKLGKCDIDCKLNKDCEVRIEEKSLQLISLTIWLLTSPILLQTGMNCMNREARQNRSVPGCKTTNKEKGKNMCYIAEAELVAS
jgi:hypothetical protein